MEDLKYGNYLNKINIILNDFVGIDNISNLKITKVNSGLTNYLFVLTFELNKLIYNYFLKLFGEISDYNLIDREFESDLIKVNSQLGRCVKFLATDNKTYRLEEYLENIQKVEDYNVFKNDDNFIFIDIIIDLAIKFESSFYLLPSNLIKKYSDLSVYSVNAVLKRIVKIAKEKVDVFNKKYINSNLNDEDFIHYYEYLNKITKYLDNFDDIYNNLTKEIKHIPLILNHNDIHKHNLILINGKTTLIDYEYSCLNHVGFDIINYCIENFFDLEYYKYPFYQKRVDDIGILFSKDKFYDIYLRYLDQLKLVLNNSKLNEEHFEILKTKNYFIKISGVCSLYWFYCALVSLNFESIVSKDNFNYLEYSLDRLSIYEKAIEILG